ncbi:MAG: deoxyribonuclease I, partial [Fibrobacter sp.]|nr:deoxyribonuclease I [Fibrobacter sp.]
MRRATAILFAFAAFFATFSEARVDPDTPPQHYNYRDASKQLRRVYYGELQETLYCGCKYNDKK